MFFVAYCLLYRTKVDKLESARLLLAKNYTFKDQKVIYCSTNLPLELIFFNYPCLTTVYFINVKFKLVPLN